MNTEATLKITVRKKDYQTRGHLFVAPVQAIELSNDLVLLHYNAEVHEFSDFGLDGWLRQHRVPYDKEWFSQDFVRGAQSCRLMDDGSLKMKTVIGGQLCNVNMDEVFPVGADGKVVEFPEDDAKPVPVLSWVEQLVILETRDKSAAYLHGLCEEDLDEEVYDMCFRLNDATGYPAMRIEQEASQINNRGKEDQVTFLINSLYRIQ